MNSVISIHRQLLKLCLSISDPDLFILLFACMQSSLLLPNQTIIDISRLQACSRVPRHALFPTPLIKKAKKPKSDTGRSDLTGFVVLIQKVISQPPLLACVASLGVREAFGHRYIARGGNVGVACSFLTRFFEQRGSLPYLLR